MPKGRPTRLKVCLTPAERATLQAWQRSHTLAVGRARRGRILLLLDDGAGISEIAAICGISRRFVYKWVARFQAHGLAGLSDLPRGPGRTPGGGWRWTPDATGLDEEDEA
jgi:helix-turn-helix protein